MYLLDLSLTQFLSLFAAGTGLLVALYLLDKTRRRQVVATLQFWIAARNPAVTRHRRRIQQPWSLVLQILGLLLLLLAIGRLQVGSRGPVPSDHIVVLDTSAFMAAQSGSSTLMAEARRLANRYVAALPAADRVMIVRADGLATPATFFESDRTKIREAIMSSQPGATSLDLDRAMSFARETLDQQARRRGEIVVITPGRVGQMPKSFPAARNIRVIAVDAPVENIGLRRIGLRHVEGESDLWEAFLSARNYGAGPRPATLGLQFAGAPVGASKVTLPPGEDKEAVFRFRTSSAGWLEARLLPDDAFAADNYARLELPERRRIQVAVYTAAPGQLKPFLASNPLVEITFRSPAQFQPSDKADLFVFHRCRPTAAIPENTIWIQPPAGSSPIAIAKQEPTATLARWLTDHPLTAGLQALDVRLQDVEIFEPKPGDLVIGASAAGPIAVARNSNPRQVFFGFDPSSGALRYDLTAPLLFANAMRWLQPDLFRQWELTAGSAGSVTLTVNPETASKAIRVADATGASLPFTRTGDTVRFFTANPGTFEVDAGSQHITYSLSLPETGDFQWEPPAGIRRGVPPRVRTAGSSYDVWWLMALLGALCLGAEWFLFGQMRQRGLPATPLLRFPWRRDESEEEGRLAS